MTVSSYSELQVWQKSMVLVKQVYQDTSPYPKGELYALTNQISAKKSPRKRRVPGGQRTPSVSGSDWTTPGRWAGKRSVSPASLPATHRFWSAERLSPPQMQTLPRGLHVVRSVSHKCQKPILVLGTREVGR